MNSKYNVVSTGVFHLVNNNDKADKVEIDFIVLKTKNDDFLVQACSYPFQSIAKQYYMAMAGFLKKVEFHYDKFFNEGREFFRLAQEQRIKYHDIKTQWQEQNPYVSKVTGRQAKQKMQSFLNLYDRIINFVDQVYNIIADLKISQNNSEKIYDELNGFRLIKNEQDFINFVMRITVTITIFYHKENRETYKNLIKEIELNRGIKAPTSFMLQNVEEDNILYGVFALEEEVC